MREWVSECWEKAATLSRWCSPTCDVSLSRRPGQDLPPYRSLLWVRDPCTMYVSVCEVCKTKWMQFYISSARRGWIMAQMSRSDADYCDLSGTEAHSFTEHVPGILESRHTRIEFRPLSFRRMNSGTPLTGVLVVSRTGPVAVVRRQILVHGHCQTLYRTGTHTNPPSNADDNLGVTSALRLPVVPWTGTQ